MNKCVLHIFQNIVDMNFVKIFPQHIRERNSNYLLCQFVCKSSSTKLITIEMKGVFLLITLLSYAANSLIELMYLTFKMLFILNIC